MLVCFFFSFLFISVLFFLKTNIVVLFCVCVCVCVLFQLSAVRAAERLKDAGPEVDKALIPKSFGKLSISDMPLMEALAGFDPKHPKHLETVCRAVANSCNSRRVLPGAAAAAGTGSAMAVEPATQNARRLLGTLSWVVLSKGVAATKFPMYLKTLVDLDLVEGPAVRAWHASSFEEMLAELPDLFAGAAAAAATAEATAAAPVCEAYLVGKAEAAAVKAASQIVIQWLDTEEEEEDDDEDEEEED
jgi:hypothetical protein